MVAVIKGGNPEAYSPPSEPASTLAGVVTVVLGIPASFVVFATLPLAVMPHVALFVFVLAVGSLTHRAVDRRLATTSAPRNVDRRDDDDQQGAGGT